MAAVKPNTVFSWIWSRATHVCQRSAQDAIANKKFHGSLKFLSDEKLPTLTDLEGALAELHKGKLNDKVATHSGLFFDVTVSMVVTETLHRSHGVLLTWSDIAREGARPRLLDCTPP